jgi:hypothetical protein
MLSATFSTRPPNGYSRAEIAGKPVVDEIRLRDEFGNVAGPDAGRLPD